MLIRVWVWKDLSRREAVKVDLKFGVLSRIGAWYHDVALGAFEFTLGLGRYLKVYVSLQEFALKGCNSI